jgi:tetratricopeptide (TPR) repeat protein
MRWTALLVLALASLAPADDKKGDKKKDAKPVAAPHAPGAGAEALARQADEKAAAGDLAGAVELLQKATRAADATGGTWLRLGRTLDRKRELDLAVDAYQAAAERLQGAARAEALGRLSIVLQAKAPAEAAATAEAAAAADASSVLGEAALAFARAHAGKGDEAAALARKAVDAGGGAPAQAALGRAEEARGDLEAAEAAYRAAMAAPDGPVAAIVGLGRVLRKTGRAAEALPLLQRVTEEAPGAIEAYKESAREKMALGRAEDAVSDAAIAAAMAEGDPEAKALQIEVTVAQALAQVARNQPDLALHDLTRLRDENPGSAVVRVGIAKALVAKRDVDGAIAELQSAVEAEPGSAEAQYQLGYVQHVYKGNPAAALPAYEKAVAAEPGNVAYRTNLGAALMAVKQYDRSLEELKKVTDSPGYDKADAWIYIGQAQVGAKRYKDAIAPLERAASIAPSNDMPYAFLAWAYFGLKDAESFKKSAAKARSLGHKEATLLDYLKRVEGGEPIK